MNSSLKDSDKITELSVFNCIFSNQSQVQQNVQEVTFIYLKYQKKNTLQWWIEILMNEMKTYFQAKAYNK